MAIVQAVSKNGFKIDSLKNDWTIVDKSLIDSEAFKSLRKGFEINIIGRNDKGLVTDFKIVNTLGINKLKEEFRLPPNPVDRNILKGQCLNIIFSNMSACEADLGHDGNREKGIRLAHRLFLELENANYYGW